MRRVWALDEGLRRRDEETGRGGESSKVGAADVVASDLGVVVTALGPVDERESVQGGREEGGTYIAYPKYPVDPLLKTLSVMAPPTLRTSDMLNVCQERIPMAMPILIIWKSSNRQF